MADLDVAMKLSMQYSPDGAKQAEADLKSLAQTASRLDDKGSSSGLSNSLDKTAEAAREANKELQKVSKTQDEIARKAGTSVPSVNGRKSGSSVPSAGDEEAWSLNLGWGPGTAAGLGTIGMSGAGGRFALGSIARFLPGPAAIAAWTSIAGEILTPNPKRALEREKEIYNFGRAMRITGAEMEQYQKSISSISRDTGKGAKEISGFITETTRFGDSQDNIKKFTAYVARSSAVWDVSTKDLGKGFNTIRTAWQVDATRIEEIGNSIGALAKHGKIAEADLLTFVSHGAQQSARLGMTADKVAAWGTALRMSGADTNEAASAFDVYAARLSNARDGGKDFQKGLKAIGLSSKAVEHGIAKDASGTMYAILQLISGLDDSRQQYQVLSSLVGEKHASAFMGLLTNLDKVNEALDITADKFGNAKAAAEDFDQLKDKDFFKVAKAEQALDTLWNRFGNIWTRAAGAVAEEINNNVDAIERGDNIIQRSGSYFLNRFGYTEMDRSKIPASMPDILEKSNPILDWIDEAFGKTGEEAAALGQLANRRAGLDDIEPTVREWAQLNQYRAELENDVANGNWFTRQTSGAQLDRLHELDEVVPDIRKRLSWDAATKDFDPFGIFGPNGPKPVTPLNELPETAQASMQRFSSTINSEGQSAISAAAAIANQIKSLLSFDAQITISPTLSAPGISAPAANSPAPRAQGKTAGQTITIGSVSVTGVRDVASLGRELSRAADRSARGQRGDALHDTGALA